MWLDAPVDLFTQPDAHGDEHEVWFAGEHVVKLTYPNFFGLRVVHRTDESQQCNPCEYFDVGFYIELVPDPANPCWI